MNYERIKDETGNFSSRFKGVDPFPRKTISQILGVKNPQKNQPNFSTEEKNINDLRLFIIPHSALYSCPASAFNLREQRSHAQSLSICPWPGFFVAPISNRGLRLIFGQTIGIRRREPPRELSYFPIDICGEFLHDGVLAILKRDVLIANDL